jgi:spore coat protein CotH
VAALAIVVILAATPASTAAQTVDEFFAGRSVEDVWVHINSRDWETLRARVTENTFYPCDLQWRSVRVYNAGCRSRGAGSRNPWKPGLDVDFDHYVTGQRFLGLSELVLDNLWQDDALLQERVTMSVFRRVGIAAPREAHVRLFVGSARQFMGLYTVVDAIDLPFLQRAFGVPDAYLYEYRWHDVYHFEDLGNELEPYAFRFEARTHEHESMFGLYSPIRELIFAINDAPLERIGEVLDLPWLINYLAVDNYLGDWDGLLGYAGLNNFYVMHVPGVPVRLIPWDKDVEFFDVMMPPTHNFEFNVLASKIRADPVAWRQYLRVLLDLAANNQAIQDEFEREFTQIEAVALADPVKRPTNEEFEAEIVRIRLFLQQRPAVVRNYIDELAPDLTR